jgi:hypothetical protein
MPDDNRFAGLGEQLDEPRQAEADRPDERADPDEGGESDDGPAFTFDETSAKSLYVRDGTLDLFEDTEFEVEATLRSDHGVRDLTSREFHDALVHVAAEHVDEIAAQIDAERTGDD